MKSSFFVLIFLFSSVFNYTPEEYMELLREELTTPEPSDITKKQSGKDYGKVESITYFSSTINKYKKAKVILPSGYSSDKKYPVLYLNHGMFGDESQLLASDMSVQQISTNLFLKGEAKQMIIVLTAMWTSSTMNTPPFSYTDEVVDCYDAFLDDLINDLMPHIKKKYPVLTGRENTAISGFSLGAREALYIGITHPELFGYIGGACPAPGIVPAKDSFMTHKGNMEEKDFKIKDTDNYPWFIFITGAAHDSVVGTFPEEYSKLLTKNGNDNVFQSVPNGDHDAVSVRAHLYNFMKFVFKATD